jgi:N-acyl-L-homoserine lactone synthetase
MLDRNDNVRVLAIHGGAMPPELAAMHRHRKRIFVDLLGWPLHAENHMEIDAFDGAGALYLIAFAGKDIAGSLRLSPTTRPSLTADVLCGFATAPMPRGPGVWDWSRHAPGDTSLAASHNETARIRLHLAVREVAAHLGIRTFISVMETWLFPRARSLEWPCVYLGEPRAYGQGEAVAVRNDVDPDALPRLRKRFGVEAPVLDPVSVQRDDPSAHAAVGDVLQTLRDVRERDRSVDV